MRTSSSTTFPLSFSFFFSTSTRFCSAICSHTNAVRDRYHPVCLSYSISGSSLSFCSTSLSWFALSTLRSLSLPTHALLLLAPLFCSFSCLLLMCAVFHRFFLFFHFSLHPSRSNAISLQDVTHVLTFLAQATHDLIPSDVLESVLMTIANNFVAERSSPESMAVGYDSNSDCSRC